MDQHKPVEIKALKGPVKGYVGQAMAIGIDGVQFIVLGQDTQSLAAAHAVMHKGKPGRPSTFKPEATFPVAIVHKDAIVEDDEL